MRTGTDPSGPATSARVRSIDVLRGLVMVLMAIDHVRVYSGLPAGGPEPALFFTRWVAHFCAPAFVFLAGSSAYLVGRKHPGLTRFLLVRGAWLILLELTFLRLAWTFNADFAGYLMLGVIWVIGCSMILMAALVKLPAPAVGALGVALIAAHNLLDPHLADGTVSSLWKLLYIGFRAGPIRLTDGGPDVMVLYTIVPWLGVMAAGYGFAALLTLEPRRRDRLCLAIGPGAILLFILLRATGAYGDPRPLDAAHPAMPALLAFLDTTKYPASLLFLLMTLGPIIAAIPLAERARGLAGDWLVVFGRVPFFFYLLHIPLIHALALAVSAIRLGEVSPWLFANHPMGNSPPPDGYTWELWLLYAVWAVALALLYPACRWFAALKARRNEWWLRYL